MRSRPHFLFQRAPSLVSSKTIPASSSSCRIWSDREKLRAFLAAARSWIELLDTRVRKTAGGLCRLQHREDAIEPIEQIERRGSVAFTKLAGVHSSIGVAYKFKERRQRFGGIQVVIQALFELVARLLESAPGSFRSRLRDTCRSPGAA